MAENTKLQALLEKAAQHKMTPAEIWDQRVSFVYGQMMDCAPNITLEQIEAAATKRYGPRPEDTMKEERDDG